MQMTIYKLLFAFYLHQCLINGLIIPKNPPEPWQAALVARYIIHNTEWVSIATISTQDTIKGYPFVTLKSFSDGLKENSTGIPFLYMTDLDDTGKDILIDKRVTIMASLAETNYCETENFDPQDPRCAKVLITGTFLKIPKSSPEYVFGLKSLFSVHPSMKTWPSDHKFYVAKVEIMQIGVLDYFGGVKHVNKDDYFNANITLIINSNVFFDNVAILELDTN